MTDQFEGSVEEILGRFPRSASVGAGPVQLARLLAEMGDVGRAVESFGLAVMTGRLDPQRRELAILRLAWTLRCGYIWSGHVLIAGDMGLDLSPARREPWSAGEALVVAAVDQLLDTGVVDDEVRNGLCSPEGDAELLHLTALVGGYRLIAMLVASRRLNPEPGCGQIPDAWPGPGPG